MNEQIETATMVHDNETITYTRNGGEVVAVYTVDGTVCDNSVAFADEEDAVAERWLANRLVEDERDGWTKA